MDNIKDNDNNNAKKLIISGIKVDKNFYKLLNTEKYLDNFLKTYYLLLIYNSSDMDFSVSKFQKLKEAIDDRNFKNFKNNLIKMNPDFSDTIANILYFIGENFNIELLPNIKHTASAQKESFLYLEQQLKYSELLDFFTSPDIKKCAYINNLIISSNKKQKNNTSENENSEKSENISSNDVKKSSDKKTLHLKENFNHKKLTAIIKVSIAALSVGFVIGAPVYDLHNISKKELVKNGFKSNEFIPDFNNIETFRQKLSEIGILNSEEIEKLCEADNSASELFNNINEKLDTYKNLKIPSPNELLNLVKLTKVFNESNLLRTFNNNNITDLPDDYKDTELSIKENIILSSSLQKYLKGNSKYSNNLSEYESLLTNISQNDNYFSSHPKELKDILDMVEKSVEYNLEFGTHVITEKIKKEYYAISSLDDPYTSTRKVVPSTNFR